MFLFENGLVEEWKSFIRPLKHLKAGGGMVRNKKGDLLSIFRKGKWDLPKGKLEPAETEEEGAIREILEETGVLVEIVHHQPIYTYHMYMLKANIIMKRTSWFKMSCIDDSMMKAQEEEGITEVRWMPKADIKPVFMANTYPTISAILSQ